MSSPLKTKPFGEKYLFTSIVLGRCRSCKEGPPIKRDTFWSSCKRALVRTQIFGR